MSLFDVNGSFMYTLQKFANIFVCNVLFCLLCIPVFTAGAALSALYSCMQAIWADDEDDMMAKQFLYAFWQNFKQGTALWLVCLLAFAFMGIYYMIISSMTGIAGRTYKISFFIMCVLFLIGFQYLFPLQARYRNSVKNTLKNAWLLGIAALPWTFLSILLTAAAVYISFFMNPEGINLAVFLWGMVGFGLVAYLNSMFFNKAFQMIDPKQLEEPMHTAPREALFIDEEHKPSEASKRKRRK